MNVPPFCKSCRRLAELTIGAEIYPDRNDLAEKPFWICRGCDAYVGTHPGSKRPLGSLAGKQTRVARMMAHKAFDRLWKGGKMSRSKAYKLLGKKIGVSNVHIGESGFKRCRRIIAATRELEAEIHS